MEAIASIGPQPVLATFSCLRKSGRDRIRCLRKKVLPLFTGIHCRSHKGYTGRKERKAALRQMASQPLLAPMSPMILSPLPEQTFELEDFSAANWPLKSPGLVASAKPCATPTTPTFRNIDKPCGASRASKGSARSSARAPKRDSTTRRRHARRSVRHRRF